MRGVGCFRVRRKAWTSKRFPSPCGVWVVSAPTQYNVIVDEFPSPCGVWVVSRLFPKSCRPGCFRPLAGCGLFRHEDRNELRAGVSVPLRGVGCFRAYVMTRDTFLEFPSPCGVWVVSKYNRHTRRTKWFPSPCGVWVVSVGRCQQDADGRSFRPLAGCGLFLLRQAARMVR